LLALVWKGITLHALVILFGAFVLVDGAMMLAAAITGAPGAEGRRGLLVLQGLLGIAAGIVTFVWPGITALALLYLIAAWAFITGTLQIAAAIRLRRQIDNEWLLGASGVLSVIFALAAVVLPVAGALAITWVIGLYALLYGAFLLGLARRVRQLESGVAGALGLDGARPRQTAT
jgi:uncharacterized membrane protein HdeD (DUF308 family)